MIRILLGSYHPDVSECMYRHRHMCCMYVYIYMLSVCTYECERMYVCIGYKVFRHAKMTNVFCLYRYTSVKMC